MAIDWSLAQQPDIVGNALKYRAAGQNAAESAYDRNALMQKNQAAELEKTRIMTGRRDAVGAYGRGDKQGAIATALGVDPELATALQKLGDADRDKVQQRAKTSASLLASWQSLPPEQREAAKAQVAPQLTAQGWTPEELQALGTDDVSIANGIGLAVDADKIIDNLRQAQPKEPTVPQGYRASPDGNLQYIPGGPADPRQAGTLAGSKRAPPRPRAAAGGSRAAGLTDDQLIAIVGAR